jgi:hypothetical protein
MIRIIQNPLRRHQIGRLEAFSKPTVNGFEAGDCLGLTALVAQQAGKARRRAKARLPSRTGLSPSSSRRCSAKSLNGPNEIACMSMVTARKPSHLLPD